MRKRKTLGPCMIEIMELRRLFSSIYVDLSAVGAGTGTSWADAFIDLQPALLAAAGGDKILIADGTYKPTTTTDRAISFVIKDAVAMYGGYAGFGTPDPNTRDLVAYPTILSGDIGVVNTTSDNSIHVLTATGLGSLTILNGVTITGGYSGSSGGGASFDNSSPFLINCTFSGNISGAGGGISNFNSNPTLTNCTFSGNSASGYAGGAIYNSSSSPTLTNCTFANNSGRNGGAMFNNQSSNPNLINCAFTRNTADFGGGISNAGSSPMLANCTFRGNMAGFGAGMYSEDSSPVLTNCLFVGNVAIGSARGGGMCNASSSPILNNCIFSANIAKYGAAISEFGSNTILDNCIVWGNVGVAGSQLDHSSGALSVSRSDVEGGWSGAGNINADPLFVRNPNPGPDGQWDGVNDDYGDLRLQAGSPCIDSGDNSLVPAGTVIDLAGNARFVDSPGVNDPGAIVDMGAYERQLPVYATGATVQTDGASPAVNVSFNVPLAVASISASDLVIQSVLGDGSLAGNIPVTAFSYDPATRSINFFVAATIADGNYRATLSAGSVADADGASTASPFTFDFFTLAGDANHDRKVDISDLAALSANWQGPSKTFSQGDFNYDGVVDSADLAILAAKWQTTLAPPMPAAPLGSKALSRRAPVRVSSLILRMLEHKS